MMTKKLDVCKREMVDDEVVQMQTSSVRSSRPGATRSNSKRLLGEKKSSRIERNSRNDVTRNNNSSKSVGRITMTTFRGLAKNGSSMSYKRASQAGVSFVPTGDNTNNNHHHHHQQQQQHNIEMGNSTPSTGSNAQPSGTPPDAVRSNSPKRLGEKKSERAARARSSTSTGNSVYERGNIRNNNIISYEIAAGRADVENVENDQDEQDQAPSHHDDSTSHEDPPTSSMATATIVREENRTQIRNDAEPMIDAHCEMVPPISTENKNENGKNRGRMLFRTAAVVLLLLIVAVIVVSVVVVGGSGDSPNDGAVEDELESIQTTTTPNINIEVDPTILPGLPVSTWEAVMDPNSPQYKAYSWVAQDPHLQQYNDSQLRQRFALATFYHALGGPRWELPNWLDYNLDECSWLNDPKGCDKDGNVVFLNITKQRGFRGSLPAEMSLLTDLKGLDFSNNVLGGDFSELFANIFDHPSLEELWCSKCRLSGTLPSELAQLPHVTVLFLSENELEGQLPSELGIMSTLVVLDLGFNHMSGQIPSAVGNMQSLQSLKLRDNQLNFIPSEIGMLSEMDYLDLSNNGFKQRIPTELGALDQLQVLDLGGNEFHDLIPPELFGLTNLKRLLLSRNDLTGSIPEAWPSLTNLEWLQLTENRLTGSIPPSVGQMTSLTKLDMGSNILTATIPTEVGLLSGLVSLHLYNNELSGSIPLGLSSLPNFRILSTKGNANIAEKLPQEFCNNINEMNLVVTDWCGFEGVPPCC